MNYVLVRSKAASPFVGYLKSRNGQEVTLLNARRLWHWKGSASLSQMAMEGTSKPSECMFPCEVSEVILTEMIEMIPVTEKAKKSIKSVPVWSK